MSGLNYPYVFECNGCGEQVEITRSDAREVVPNSKSLDAITEVLRQTYRWSHDRYWLYCRECEPEGAVAG